jgi:complement component 1 Q subcomponent-binding protein, mitochondrial
VEEGQEDEESTPIQVAILIEKGQGPVLEIDASAQGDAFYIDNVALVESSQLANDQTAQGDWVRRGNYGGPVFNDLDEGLVESFHNYIEARGFNQELAQFVADYAVHKEQKEYTAWLEKVGKFVKA